MAAKGNDMAILSKKQKKFPLGCDASKEEIFDYPYLSDKDTISVVKDHGQVMFIIRGPNSTMKATLSEMIQEKYPSAQHCCADRYFTETFSSKTLTKDSLKLSHEYCRKKVESACKKKESPIIVQNTHMRKFEFQEYLDLAAVYNYVVIMAITLYKFDVTPQGLANINPDGLQIRYFQNRLRQWEDVPPLFTGWFLSPGTAAFVHKSLKMILASLLDDGKFCRMFDCYDEVAIWNYFAGRRNLYCVAGYSYSTYLMKKYYMSDRVQECYGKSFDITIDGFLITKSDVMAIVHIDPEIKHLLYKENSDTESSLCEQLSSLELDENIIQYKSTVSFSDDSSTSEKNIVLEDGIDDNIDLKNCQLIHVAQKQLELFDLKEAEKSLPKIRSISDDDTQFWEFEEDISICRLPDDEWLVKLSKKIKAGSLFTGLYV